MFNINETMLSDNRALIAKAPTKQDIDSNLKPGMLNYTSNNQELYLTLPTSLNFGKYNRLIQENPEGKIPHDITFKENVVIEKSLTVLGGQFEMQSQNVVIEDNMIEINKGEIGAGISLNYAGMKINRGTLPHAYYLYSEPDKGFILKVGDITNATITEDGDIIARNNLKSKILIASEKITTDVFQANGIATFKHYLISENDATFKQGVSMLSDLGIKGNLNVIGIIKTDSTLTTLADADIGLNLKVGGVTLLESAVDIKDSLSVTGSITTDDEFTTNKNLNVGGDSYLQGNLEVSNNFTVLMAATFKRDSLFEGPSTFKDYVSIQKGLSAVGPVNIAIPSDFKSTDMLLTIEGNSKINGNLIIQEQMKAKSGVFDSDITAIDILATKINTVDITISSDLKVGANIEAVGSLTINGETHLEKNLTVVKNATINNDFTVLNKTTLKQDVNILEDAIISGQLTTRNKVVFEDELSVKRKAIFQSSLQSEEIETKKIILNNPESDTEIRFDQSQDFRMFLSNKDNYETLSTDAIRNLYFRSDSQLDSGFVFLSGDNPVFQITSKEIMSALALKIEHNGQWYNVLHEGSNVASTDENGNIRTNTKLIYRTLELVDNEGIMELKALSEDEEYADLVVRNLIVKGNASYDKVNIATSDELGHIRSGGDISVNAETGIVSVVDDSHQHTFATIQGLQDILDSKATIHLHPYLPIHGIADSARKLAQSSVIALEGDVEASFSFDGATNVVANVQVKNDSHLHSVATIRGLEDKLAVKADIEHTHEEYLGKLETSESTKRLNLARKITLSGAVTGSVDFDGSEDISIVTAIANEVGSTISMNRIDGLEEQLRSKSDIGHNHDDLYTPIAHVEAVATDETVGHVKAGNNVSISENGSITVNDYGHKHTVANIDGLDEKIKSLTTTYTYKQLQPTAVWYVNHNLNKKPSVMITDTTDEQVIGDIKYIDDNKVEITFSTPLAGRAYIN